MLEVTIITTSYRLSSGGSWHSEEQGRLIASMNNTELRQEGIRENSQRT